MNFKPGDLLSFSGLIGEDRGPCLVLAVTRFENTQDVLLLLPRRQIRTFVIQDKGVIMNGITKLNDDD